MLELPEVMTLYKDLNNTILNKKIVNVKVNQSPHKFTFYYGDPNEYSKILIDKKITDIKHYGFYILIEAEDTNLLFRDGANLRYHNNKLTLPNKHQLLIEFNDGTFLTVTVVMYGGIWCFKKGDFNDDKYFNMAKKNISPIDDAFDYSYFNKLFLNCKNNISSKAFLATEQRISGIGNGVVQDILFNAKIHPKRKLNTFNENEKKLLFNSIKNTLNLMIKKNGRDTEKDLFNNPGNYKTILSRNNITCPICGEKIIKENYLGGSIYYCANCQKL